MLAAPLPTGLIDVAPRVGLPNIGIPTVGLENVVAPRVLVPNGLDPNELVPSGFVPNELIPNELIPNELVPNELVPNALPPNVLVPSVVVPREFAPIVLVPMVEVPNVPGCEPRDDVIPAGAAAEAGPGAIVEVVEAAEARVVVGAPGTVPIGGGAPGTVPAGGTLELELALITVCAEAGPAAKAATTMNIPTRWIAVRSMASPRFRPWCAGPLAW
ncbi:MAG TPA: hypothetical protein VEV18_08460 [Steroidobacteraceae bacterium]|nr:hypothetical protein [Steroidobacteraceae bacterium]